MNRKLIRPNLADVKPPERDSRNSPERSSGGSNAASSAAAPRRTAAAAQPQPARSQSAAANVADSIDDNNSGAAKSGQRRSAPPAETNAKIYYYKKQIDSHTRMRILLQDNEELEGTIEWYDRGALKINRKDAPNIMLLEHNIKYMYKVED